MHSVPECNGGNYQVESAGVVTLVLKRAVADLAKAVKEDAAGKRISRLSFIDAGGLALQKDGLKHAKCRQVYVEQASGKNSGRPQLEVCLKSLRAGDTLVV